MTPEEEAVAFRSMIALLRAINDGRIDDASSLLESDNLRDVAEQLADHVLQMYASWGQKAGVQEDKILEWIDGTLGLTLSMHLIDYDLDTD